ncbi:MAG TPA: hypothetical protein VMS96_01280 [Terriglobales bacterium]|nr:hypothetical protein [Terriglobales bacterium]
MVVFCALLVALALSIEAAHVHPNGNANEKHCSICSGAHFAMPVVQAQHSGKQAATSANNVPKQVKVAARELPFNLFDRPPPPTA